MEILKNLENFEDSLPTPEIHLDKADNFKLLRKRLTYEVASKRNKDYNSKSINLIRETLSLNMNLNEPLKAIDNMIDFCCYSYLSQFYFFKKDYETAYNYNTKALNISPGNLVCIKEF